MSKKNYLGFVIKATKLKESDLIVNIFTASEGIESFYLKNANLAKSKRGRQIEILNLISFSTQHNLAKTSLAYVNELKLESNSTALKSLTTSYIEAFVIAEVLTKVLPPGEPLPELFELLLEIAHYPVKETARLIFLYLGLNLLKLLGYLPELDFSQLTQEKLNPELGINLMDEGIGYYQTSDSVNLQILRSLKIQLYLTRHNLNEIAKLNISQSDLDWLFNLLLSWFEYIMESKLNSKLLLITK